MERIQEYHYYFPSARLMALFIEAAKKHHMGVYWAKKLTESEAHLYVVSLHPLLGTTKNSRSVLDPLAKDLGGGFVKPSLEGV